VLLGAGDEPWQLAFRMVGWALVIWGTVLYWSAAVLYLRQGFAVIDWRPQYYRSGADAVIMQR